MTESAITAVLAAVDPKIWAAVVAYCNHPPSIPMSAEQVARRYERMVAAIAAYEETSPRRNNGPARETVR